MKSILAQKATLSFNITNNKMSTKIFQNYNNSGLYLSLEEVKERIEDLTSELRGNEFYYRRHKETFTEKEKEQKYIDQCLAQQDIELEIDFYEQQIDAFEDEEDEKKSVEEKTSALDRAALIKNYHNPSLLICILEARTIMSDLTDNLKQSASYFRCFKHSLSKEQIQEEKEIQQEIEYYGTAIFRTQQAYKEDAQSLYGYSLRPRTPSVSDSDSEDEVEKEPETKIDSLEKKLKGVDNVVYQLIGGLFNQKTQSHMIDSHLYCLNGVKYTGKIDEDTIWPTTRQGYQNEEEIKLLKQQVSKLEGTVEMLVHIIKDQNRYNNDTSISSR
jgi:hypothetical protein